MTNVLDMTTATALRVAGVDAKQLRIGNADIWLKPFAETRRNLITNPAPTSIAAWQILATASFDTGWAKSVASTNATSYFWTPTVPEAVAAGQVVTLSFEYVVDTVAGGVVATHIRTCPHKRVGNVYYTAAQVIRPIVVGQVERVSITWTTTAAFNASELEVAAVSSQAGGGVAAAAIGFTWRARRVVIERGATSGSYFDGSTAAPNVDTRYRWLGTANASASVEEKR